MYIVSGVRRYGISVDSSMLMEVLLIGPVDQDTTDKLNKKREENKKEKKMKRDAKEKARREELGARRAQQPNVKPCPACGEKSHSRSTNKLCKKYKPRKSIVTELKRTSTIKTGLMSTCSNEILKQVLLEVARLCRNTSQIASLFVQYVLVGLLKNNQDIPTLDHNFIYQAFAQVIGQGKKAPEWLKNEYQSFKVYLPNEVDKKFWRHTPMITTMAKDYAKNISNYVVDIFESKTIDYIFIRLSQEADPWYLPKVTVANRKKLAAFIYKKAASQDAKWPELDANTDRRKIETFAKEIDLGPTPISDSNLAAYPHHYLPWLYKVLQRFEQPISIKEPEPQKYVSKAYVHRKLKEVSKKPIYTFIIQD